MENKFGHRLYIHVHLYSPEKGSIEEKNNRLCIIGYFHNILLSAALEKCQRLVRGIHMIRFPQKNVFLSGMLDRRQERDTVLEQDRYGSMICNVLEQKLTFSTVVTVAGVNTTVYIMKMFPSLAAAVSMVMYRMISNVIPVCA